MPSYSVPAHDFNVFEHSMVLDTNVLVNAFCAGEKYHDQAKYFIDEWDARFIVPIAVVVETWGFMVGKEKRWNEGFEFVAWLLNPGSNVDILPTPHEHMDGASELSKSLHIDCVDSLILHLANEISCQCDLRPALKIASYDTQDLTKQQLRGKVRFRLFDMMTLEAY